jgi:hypothetical protein
MQVKNQIFVAQILRQVNVAEENSYCEVTFVIIQTPTLQEAEILANNTVLSIEYSAKYEISHKKAPVLLRAPLKFYRQAAR